MANQCYNQCIKIKPVVQSKQDDDDNSTLTGNDIDLSPYEISCVNKCSERVNRLNKMTERHIDEQINPMFVNKYI